MTTKSLTISAILLSLVLIMAPLTIPIGIVPVSLQTFIVPLAVALLPRKRGFLLVVAYLLLGIFGLPVFANWHGGLGVLFGPTGGYLLGLLAFPMILGNWQDTINPWWSLGRRLLFSGLIQLIVGALWLGIFMKMDGLQALQVGVIPFIFVLVVKTVCVIGIVRLLAQKSDVIGTFAK